MNTVIEKKVLLTPELARELLKNNDPRQRPLTGWAHQLARDIINGRWNEDADRDPIDININGKLQNGQHRCMAVIIADKPINVLIRYNCPDEWFDFYDRNKGRTVSDLYKGKYRQCVSAVTSFIIAYDEGAKLTSALYGVIYTKGEKGISANVKANVKATTNEILGYMTEHSEELEAYAELGHKVWRTLNGGSLSMYTSAMWLLHRLGADYEMISEIVGDLYEAAPTNRNLYVLKAWAVKTMAEFSRMKSKPDRRWAFAYMLACYDAYFEKSEIKRPKMYIDKCFEKYNALADKERGIER